MTPKTTIIMTAKNRLELTKQAIETLRRNTVNYHLILMPDCPSEEVRDYLKSLNEEIYFVDLTGVKPEADGMKSHYILQAMAVSLVNTEYFYFTDNDVYFLPHWLNTLHTLYNIEENVGIVGGRTHAFHKVIEEKTVAGMNYRITDQQSGYSVLMKKSIWNKFGLGRPTNSFNDVGLCDSVRGGGYKIISPVYPVLLHCGITRSDGTKVVGYEEELKQPFPPDCIYQ